MVFSRAVQNSSVLQKIFRRIALTGGDIRATNVFSPYSFSSDCLEKERFLPLGHCIRSVCCIRTMTTEAGSSKSNEKTNRLISEKSPYLLQHATNPVDWYPWGQEAFDKAKAEDKLIFLSVGYSTCHWCHVMEKESFENESVAEIMNRHFVNIKVDREERPDVDKLYMSFIQATVGGGGWPMSVFLTPELQPIAGGTYFPPEDKYGRPGFKTVLQNIAEQWRRKRSSMQESGKYSLEILRKIAEKDSKASTAKMSTVPGEDVWKKCLLQFTRNYEADFGGFNTAPKFPQPVNFNCLFHMYSRNKQSEQGFMCLQMCLHTLTKMAYGGIHDHVNCGFARYSVDDRWHVPHFEKMLYDQAQLAVSYCDAFVLTKDDFYADVVRDILTYVSRDLSHPLGGFYGAQDADSYPYHGAPHKMEGAFCVWELGEIQDLLQGKETDGISHLDLFVHHYNVKKDGNVKPSQDPHGELLNKNVLVCFESYQSTANAFNTTEDTVKQILKECHSVLYQERQKRPPPDTDTKIVTSWNGLMISGYAKAGFALKDQAYIDRAIRAADFIRNHLWREEDKTLMRCCYKGKGEDQVDMTADPVPGFLDDHAFLIRGLLDLYEASLNADWLQWAETLQEQQDLKFWDSKAYGYFTSPEGNASILIRGKEDQDGAEPCGNSVAVHNLIRLAAYLDRRDLRDKATNTLSAFAERLNSIPIALPEMVSALMFYHNSPTQVFIAGPSDDRNTQLLLDEIRTRYLPGRLLALADGSGGGLLYRRHGDALARLRPVQGKPAAYVCRNFACRLPVTEPEELGASLDEGNGVDKSNEGNAGSSKE